MLRQIVVAIAIAMFAPAGTLLGAEVGPSQAQPRQSPPSRTESDSDRQAEPRRAQPREPQPAPAPRTGPDRAQPRPPAAPPQRQSAPRRTPPPRDVTPQYWRETRVYVFPPVSLHRGFYYHPYFGFYFGPYYGPYYPHPGPVFRSAHFGALRTRVRPVETEVWVNGYYAGVVDDFDGVFQRLSLPAGEHEIEFHLSGYRTFRQKLYLQPGDTRDIRHDMQRLAGTDLNTAPMTPRELPEEWTSGGEALEGDLPASPFGVLGLRIEPADAEIVIDGEVWLGTNRRTELVIHAPAGWHQIEVRKAGYQPFRTEVELSEGTRVRLNVRLVQ
jgi:hypothetical protein